jgi:uncharacterized protein (TIGR00730 family)
MNICVFCGSSMGAGTRYVETARELGSAIATRKHRLIYGGGNVGLMGIIADTVLEKNGEVIGVIPDFLVKREVGHSGLTRLEIVNTMHERKKRMADLSDAFVAIPGGIGTLDELAEILTWKQLGLIHQPIAILNVYNFFDPLISQLTHMVQEGFLKKENFSSIFITQDTDDLINRIHP